MTLSGCLISIHKTVHFYSFLIVTESKERLQPGRFPDTKDSVHFYSYSCGMCLHMGGMFNFSSRETSPDSVST